MDRCNSCRYQNDFEFHACHICAMERDMYKPKQTNADRIRSMTDEKLAEWIERLESPKCPCDDWYYRCEKIYCDGCWLEWLKQEANDGNN